MSNRKEIYVQGHIVTITRRFLNKETGRMRVRVHVKTFSGETVHNVSKDFDDMHTGDTAYSKQISKYSA